MPRRRSDPDPNPGIGGYTAPRGPYGEGGYSGSTAWTRQNPQAAADRLHNAPARPSATPPFGRRYTVRRAPTIGQQQANQIPYPAHQGGIPFTGPHSATNPARVRDTERRPDIVLSKGSKGGGERVRNDYYRGGRRAQPGQDITVRSASKGRHFPVTDVTVPGRYTYGGVNGGTDTMQGLLDSRRAPYTGQGGFRIADRHPGQVGGLGHAKGSVRGAVLDGTQFRMPAITRDTRVSKQGGAVGRRQRGTVKRHRATIFNEPAGWAGKSYVTTAETGSPDVPGRNSQVVQDVTVSPAARPARSRWGVTRGAR